MQQNSARVKLTRWRDLPDWGNSLNDGQVWTNKAALKIVSLYRGLLPSGGLSLLISGLPAGLKKRVGGKGLASAEQQKRY